MHADAAFSSGRVLFSTQSPEPIRFHIQSAYGPNFTIKWLKEE